MSFYSEYQKRSLLRHSGNAALYEHFFGFRDWDGICRNLLSMITAQHSTLTAESRYSVRPGKLTEDMNRILVAGDHPPIAYRTVKAIFEVSRDTTGNGARSMEISRRYNSGRLYVERRYWGQEETLALCIAARLSEDEAAKILGPMMGQPWRYLRDPYMLVADYALNRGLTAEQTAQLLTEARTKINACPILQIPDTNQTEQIRVCYQEELRSKARDTPEQAMERFRAFVEREKERLAGDFARAIQVMCDLILFNGWPDRGILPDSDFQDYFFPDGARSYEKTNVKHLAQVMARTFTAWEVKGRANGKADDPERFRLVRTDAKKEDIMYEHLRGYMHRPEYRDVRHSEMRMDLLRLLLIYRITDIPSINRCLEDLSFCALDPTLPFDFFVLSAIAHGTDPNRWERNGDPHQVLADLMAYYENTIEGDDDGQP